MNKGKECLKHEIIKIFYTESVKWLFQILQPNKNKDLKFNTLTIWINKNIFFELYNVIIFNLLIVILII